MRQALDQGVFPGAVLLAGSGGRRIVHAAYGIANLYTQRPMNTTTIFDLASLTKPLATTLAVMLLCQRGRLELDQRLATVLPAVSESDKRDITIAQLLSHVSGLPAYRPYFRPLVALPPPDRRPRLRQLLVSEPLQHPPGAQVLYSDLDFMFLEWVVETVAGRRLDGFLAREVYGPLQASPLFFIDRERPVPQGAYAATERCPWRGRLMEAEVHDENAHVLGGVAGHAGLFGTAAAVQELLEELLAAYHEYPPSRLFHGEVVRRFWQPLPGGDKALGFDLPSASHPSCGRFFPPDSVGHLGFTGTSFWVHRERRATVVLLTNRVHPTRENIAIRQFRPAIHDAVMEAVLSAP
jgi:CubicO group peptidase (beta-lactamase class C family)